ncbi:MAG: ABC transporter permease [Flavobacteriaceae bacterium]|nr:ABC transporter permease [Bacteroidia bacterium]NNL15810.1 ABC transporter permease [Flavobacteriaceae bacterium]
MNAAIYIAKRYLFTKSSNNAINFISIIAAIGVIIGSASLFIVLSGFAGLKDFSLQFTTMIDPDIKAMPVMGKSFFISQDELIKLEESNAIKSYSKIIEERVILNFDNKKRTATIKGVDINYQNVNKIDSLIYQGSWLSKDLNQIVVGWGISNDLSFGVLDYAKTIDIYVPKPGKGQITSINSAFNSVKVVNAGIFQINEDLDNKFVFANLKTAQELLNYKTNQLSAIEFNLNENADEEEAIGEIQRILGDKVILKNRAQLNDALYKMLNTENLAVYLIFTLVLIIALFNVIGSIIMMILDKKKSLNTLFNLGFTIKDIRNIFFYQGSLMSLFGGVIGLGLGFVIIILQKTFSMIMITPSLAYPVSVIPSNFVIVLFTISILGIIASKIASQRITRNLIEN